MEDKQLKLNITYPFSEEFNFETYIERINFDADRIRKIKLGKSFIIDRPQGIKKDIKNKTGIFDKRFGSNSISDTDSFSTAYRCECGKTTGSIRSGEQCRFCKTLVKYVGDDISKNAYLVLNDSYWIIHPNLYRSIEAFIGATRLNNIIEPEVNIGLDGMIVDNKKKKIKKDEIYAGIGILEFKERFPEIMGYYLKKYPQKKMYYDDIMQMYLKGYVFTHTISIFNSRLRPCSIDEGTLKYEACNDQFNLLANLVYACNDDKLHIHRKKKNKLTLLYDIQTNLNDVYAEIKDILSKKKGDIRLALGGRYSFSERSIIKQDITLQANQVKLPFHGLCELLQQLIINILVKSYNFSYADAYKKWYKCQITGNDKVIYDIIDGMIRDSDGGLPVFINRNPTIQMGGILACRVVGINMDYTMSISVLVLKLLAADFDGDTLNILYLYNKDVIERADKILNPKMMYISRNDGKCNEDMLFTRDIMINANSMKSLCEYSQEELNRIYKLQSMEV